MRAEDYPYLRPRFVALAHRGGAGLEGNLGRENSVRAFRTAVDLGYRYLETDVHTTADGTLVALHDASLDRVTDATGQVAELPWAEVSQASIGGTEPIPTLDELLETFPTANFNIDIKSAGAIAPLAEAIGRHAAWDRVLVGSFGVDRIRAFRRLAGPRVPTAVSPAGVAFAAYALGVRRLWPSTGVAFQIPVRVWHERLRVLSTALIAAAHAAGRVVHVWTIDDPAEMHRLIDLGVDGLVSDRIDILKDVLTQRGLWDGEP